MAGDFIHKGSPTALELCAGGGGQALGLEWAGFHHVGVVEREPHACATLRNNRPHWKIIQHDIRKLRGTDFSGVDLLAGGVPCPPFSIAGKQLGRNDERDMFPATLHLVETIKPRAVMLENVPGFASGKFAAYRREIMNRLAQLGYQVEFRVLRARDFGVPQIRARCVLVALRPQDAEFFCWPDEPGHPPTVGEVLVDLMGENGWPGATAWAAKAAGIAPTIVGGSHKHGGPDLGPTRTKQQWRRLHVDGSGIADAAPGMNFPLDELPRLTMRMVARLQGFPDAWVFCGNKTAVYRQVGNAFPPQVARAVGLAIRNALEHQSNPHAPQAAARQMLLFK